MPPDLFRGAFIALFSALSVLRLVFRLKTGLLRRGLYSPEEPVVFIVVRYLLGVPLLAGVFFYIFRPGRLPWQYLRLPDGVRLAGIALGAGALALLARVHQALGPSFSTGPAPREGQRLVREGPYARVRHPMYAAYFLLFSAAFLISESWLIGSTGLAIIGMLMSLRLAAEEALLVRRYGWEYLGYRERTGRFLPRLRAFRPRFADGSARHGSARRSRVPAPAAEPPPGRHNGRSPRTASARRR